MDLISHSYYSKLTADSESGRRSPISSFEKLNAPDWDDFLFDLIREDPLIFDVLQPNQGTDIIAFALSIFQQLAPAQQRNVAESAIRLAKIEAASERRSEQYVILYISLLRPLNHDSWARQAMLLYSQKQFSERARIEILRSMAPHAKAAIFATFWNNAAQEVKSCPGSIPVLARILGELNPQLALTLILTAPEAITADSMEPALRATLISLAALPDWRVHFQRFQATASEELRATAEDFSRLPVLAAKFRALNESEQWKSFCDHCVEHEFTVPFVFFRYYSKSKDQDSPLPPCLESYVAAYTRAVSATAECELRYEETVLQDTNETVDEALDWRLLLVEPMHITPSRAREADIIQMGISACCGLVLPKSSRSWFAPRAQQPLYFASSEFPNRDVLAREAWSAIEKLPIALRQVYSLLRLNARVNILTQPNTTNEGVLSELFRQVANVQPRGTRAYLPIDISLMPDYLSRPGRDSSPPEYGALLDWGYALDVMSKCHRDCDLYLIRYDTPLPVGFIYPKGDFAWRNTLLRIIQSAILSKSEYLIELESVFSSQLVSVNLDAELKIPAKEVAV